MSNTDISIFTNQDVKMADRMKSVLHNAEYFDCLVGYFRITGFYLLKADLEKVSEIRFLIGLDTDETTAVTIWDSNRYQKAKKLKQQIVDEFNNSFDNLEVENGINTFIKWIENGKLKIRMCEDKNVHAKVYIIRNNQEVAMSQYGHVITGSSNFSCNGLEKNIEFNVELKNRQDVEYAVNFFDSLWEKSIEVTNDVKEIVESETWMNVSITPYEMYLKALYSYFEEEIGDSTIELDLPDNFIRLQYQEHAVIQAKKILEKHGGVFIADVVGLGKTYIAAMLGKYLDNKKRKLFIVPPVVKEYWESVLSDFGYSQKDKVISLGIVDRFAELEDLSKYDYVFVDEAHRFRNIESKEFQYLKQICYGKGVILITATPQNNYITDIANLISLFQDMNQSSIIPGNPDLDGFFRNLRKKVDSAKGKPNFQKELNKASAEIRDKVLMNVMIRRTRTEVMKYYKEDLDAQNVFFPILHNPIRLPYIYNDQMDEAFNITIELMKDMKFARYTPLLYVQDKNSIGDLKSGQENIKGFMKALLVKRLESSIYAFCESIKRIKRSHDLFKQMYDEDRIFMGNMSKSNKITLEEILDLSDDDLLDLMENSDLKKINRNDLTEHFIMDLNKDIDILKKLIDIWGSFDIVKDDAKYDLLVYTIKNIKKEHNDKLIIFTEAKDTVNYLENKLNVDFCGEVITYSGQDSQSKKDYIKQNFDPKDRHQLDEKKILVSTDAMSEGVNLHKANTIINYDLPWNPTRVMQRVGRINRVGSSYTDLFVYNFFPSANAKIHLSLEERVKTKIQMFHTMLGEDSKYLTDEEVVSSQEFFDVLMMKDFKLIDEGEEFNLNASKMEQLKVINDISRNDTALFEKIKILPNKLRIARNSSNSDELVSFIKKGMIKEFFSTNGKECIELDFDTAIKKIKAKIDEKRLNIPGRYYDLLDINSTNFNEKVNDSFGNGYKAKGTPKNLKIIRQYLFSLKNQELKFDEKETVGQVEEMIQRGVLTNYIYKQILAAINKLGNEKYDVHKLIKSFEENIPLTYFKERKNYEVKDISSEKETIILSEYFINGGK